MKMTNSNLDDGADDGVNDGADNGARMNHFHPAVSGWFGDQFARPTPPQRHAWEAIASGSHVLLAAPTGSGKTLAAFLTAIDRLVKEAGQGRLSDQVRVVYVSPLKALSNDIQRNLEVPLEQIHARLESAGGHADTPVIRAAVRSGDTTPAERARMIKKPPHILVTTPESLYILLTSESGRQMLRTSETLIIDEIHALAATKRGAHLALSMERLQALCATGLTRIGLSATQEPIDTVAAYLTGADVSRPCRIVNSGHARRRDMKIELIDSPLQAVLSGEMWDEVYERLQQLIEAHRTTLIFVNTRRMAERMAKALSERLATQLGREAVTAHHGSLAKEHRLDAEQRLKAGTLRALIATASLELGIDIGDIDLVCQVGSCRGINVFLQRVGRSGHQVEAVPKGRLFPLSRDDLLECVAILDAVKRGQLDQLALYPQPLDVLAQQIVAEVAGAERSLDELYQLVVRAAPYRTLVRKKFDQVVQMLADGFSTRRGRRSAYLHLDAVNARVRPRRGARLAALTNGGTIADQFDYDVILQPDGHQIGTLNEDFSFESLPGDIFQLGNTAYRILKVEPGKVMVNDASGQPPNIPFWFGNAPGRSDALSEAVSRARRRIGEWLREGIEAAINRVIEEFELDRASASQLVDYLGAAQAALGALPTTDTVIFERFFDQAGDQHLVVHSTFGSRVNRAWGLALRKRFCRKFNFELQAAALDDTLVLSLGSTHSFALEDAAAYLRAATVREVLTQALLAVPMFPTQWRWNASIALAVKRFVGGKKNPPQFQRSDAEDLVAVVFPDQIACPENLAGEREIPPHPLVEQTLYDCLNDWMDIERLEKILTDLQAGRITLVCRDLTAPSPLAEQVLTARRYAFLDDAPAEERRTSLVRARQFMQPEDAAVPGQLNAHVIEQVRREAWPDVRDADECHDALMMLGVAGDHEAGQHGWRRWLDELAAQRRATQLRTADAVFWVAAERLALLRALYPGASLHPEIEPVVSHASAESADALTELIRFRLQATGPVSTPQMAALLHLEPARIDRAMEMLEHEGYAMRGHFDPLETALQWCERGLLARIHRRTIKHLREQVRPASIAGFMRFLFHWHGIVDDRRGEPGAEPGAEPRAELNGADSLDVPLAQLEGVEVPGGAWESEVLPLRINGYRGHWLDQLCAGGTIRWARLSPPDKSGRPGKTSLKVAPIALLQRRNMKHWLAWSKAATGEGELSANARRVLEIIRDGGARFFDELVDCGGWLKVEVENALSELAARGLVASDSFSGFRALAATAGDKSGSRFARRPRNHCGLDNAGRWCLVRDFPPVEDHWESVEHIARVLLKRYGVVFRKLLELESNLPGWRDLHYIYRRMEARGEVRGGRFVNGFSGEQFALPDAVGALRRIERKRDDALLSVSAADPLNLSGVILPGERTPALGKNRILFRNGNLIATLTADKVTWLEPVPRREQWAAQQKLISVPASKPEKYRHRRYGGLR